jgi:hypothetical protein
LRPRAVAAGRAQLRRIGGWQQAREVKLARHRWKMAQRHHSRHGVGCLDPHLGFKAPASHAHSTRFARYGAALFSLRLQNRHDLRDIFDRTKFGVDCPYRASGACALPSSEAKMIGY